MLQPYEHTASAVTVGIAHHLVQRLCITDRKKETCSQRRLVRLRQQPALAKLCHLANCEAVHVRSPQQKTIRILRTRRWHVLASWNISARSQSPQCHRFACLGVDSYTLTVWLVSLSSPLRARWELRHARLYRRDVLLEVKTSTLCLHRRMKQGWNYRVHRAGLPIRLTGGVGSLEGEALWRARTRTMLAYHRSWIVRAQRYPDRGCGPDGRHVLRLALRSTRWRRGLTFWPHVRNRHEVRDEGCSVLGYPDPFCTLDSLIGAFVHGGRDPCSQPARTDAHGFGRSQAGGARRRSTAAETAIVSLEDGRWAGKTKRRRLARAARGRPCYKSTQRHHRDVTASTRRCRPANRAATILGEAWSGRITSQRMAWHRLVSEGGAAKRK
jgi:hypothetical protein